MDKIYVFPHSKSRLLLNITHISVVKTGCFEFKLLNIYRILPLKIFSYVINRNLKCYIKSRVDCSESVVSIWPHSKRFQR